ncbi:MAG: hypothetical protein M1311_05750 [Thaumarchaeota archaeon]|jgi:hypothetical protein|nr:hypothetical protein [Nitrososphaerota archaeon]MDG6945248.1 hypothetical protein [Nitrososphaerota archaeon]MDG6963035.1 hypothetical protein [Nitrososphaerota archaeon]MDG6980414.1 hypothetical protein [Nitrososphaerota archaeon]MDG7016948.1 hypothetical protein [Nitrososphaerota archaeon]
MIEERNKSSVHRLAALVSLSATLILGLVLSYYGYIWAAPSVNPAEFAGALVFWAGFVCLLLAFPLRAVFLDFTRSLKTVLGPVIFAGYLATHLILYGFVLEGIVTAIQGPQLLGVSTSSLYVYTDTFVPPSLFSALSDLSYNPAIIFTYPPEFSAALSFYSISMAVVIAILVVANVGKTRELGKICSASKRAKSFVLVPMMGIILGSSCCLSVAGLVSFYLLPVALADALASNLLLYYFTYFVLPAFAVAILYLNYVSVAKLSSTLSGHTSGPSLP